MGGARMDWARGRVAQSIARSRRRELGGGGTGAARSGMDGARNEWAVRG